MYFKNKISKDDKGFTLIEVIVTVVIVALVTAPLLSSFISASNTNMKSKRIQESNELSQYVVEELKGTSIAYLKNAYGSNMSDKHNDGSYDLSLTGMQLPSGFQSGYKIDAKIKPSTVVTKEETAIPVIEDLNKESCAVFCSGIYKYDNFPEYDSATKRFVTVTIGYDAALATTKPYTVELKIEYYNGNTNLGFKSAKWNYAVVPSVYILYTPLSGTDELYINNDIDYSYLPDLPVGEGKVDTYIVQQNASGSYSRLEENKVHINGYTTLSTLHNSLVQVTSANLNNLRIHSNIGSSAASVNEDVTEVTESICIDTLYSVDISVSYRDKKISNYNASKIEIN